MATVAHAESIDRQSSVPYYEQLAGALERRIVGGRITAGSRLPSENELCTEFGLSRATVRQGLRHLEARGFAHRVPGRGVFASEPDGERGWVIQEPEGFLENAISHQNRSVATSVLSASTISLPAHACRALEVPEGTVGFELVRLRRLDGCPALYSVNYSPPDLVPVLAAAHDVLAGRAPLSRLLASAGYHLGEAHRAVRAVAASGDTARHLAVSAGTPLLHIRSTSWTAEGRRYDVYDTWVRSDVIPLEVNVVTTGAARR